MILLRDRLTLFQSPRVARPQDGSKALNPVSLLSSSARFYLDGYEQRMLRPFSEIADMETRMGPPAVTFDPVFQHSRRHYEGFVRDLVKAGSADFAEDAVAHFGLFFVAKKAGAQRFIIDARASNRHFLRPPAGPMLTGEGLCHVEFQGTPEDTQNWFVGSADISKYVPSAAYSRVSASVFALPAVLASEVGYSVENDQPNKTCSRFFDILVPTRLPLIIRGRCSFVKMSRITARSREVLTILFSLVTTARQQTWHEIHWLPLVIR